MAVAAPLKEMDATVDHIIDDIFIAWMA